MRILDEISWIADKSIHNTGAQMEKLRERSGAAGHIYEPPTTPPLQSTPRHQNININVNFLVS